MTIFQDIFLLSFLAFLEAILSIDNAVVLAIMVKHLPKEQQRRALTYGLGGAIVFRLMALGLAAYLMHWRWVKFVGGGYLIFIAVKHLLQKKGEHPPEIKAATRAGFWKTVLMIELMDIAFAVDSILAAVAVSNKFWIVFAGGMMGVVLIRYAASFFTQLLQKFPGFELSAYLLVLTIGIKLFIDGFHFEGVDFNSWRNPAFWIFWSLMAACVGLGFKRKSR